MAVAVIDYDYARGMLIMYKPWNKNNTLDKLLKNKQRTFEKQAKNNQQLFLNDRPKKVPMSVQPQYVTAMKYAGKKNMKYL